MKIAAAVILYNPEADVVENIKTYHHHVSEVFIYDNSETLVEAKAGITKLGNISYMQDFVNDGLAKRLNEACQKAIDNGYDWLLTMDQDSRFENNLIEKYLNCIENFSDKDNVAMFGIAFNRKEKIAEIDCSPVEEKLITSGSVVNLSLFKTIGKFDENLFIDGVDYDYCFRSQILNYRIMQFKNILLKHSVGTLVTRASVKSFFLIKKTKEVHSALRCYYMFRNMLYLKKKYEGKDGKYFEEIKGYVHSRIKVSLLYGRNIQAIIKMLKKANKDARHNKMGRIIL